MLILFINQIISNLDNNFVMMKNSMIILTGLNPNVKKALGAIYGDLRDKRRFTFTEFMKTPNIDLRYEDPNLRNLIRDWRSILDKTLTEMNILKRYKTGIYYTKKFRTLEGWAGFYGDSFIKSIRGLEYECLVNAIKRKRIKKTRKILEIEKKFNRGINELLAEFYLEKSLSTYEIAKKMNVSNSAILNWLKRCGIRTTSGVRIEKPGKNELKRLYVNQRKSTLGIAKKFGISVSTAYKWLKDYGIEIRDRSSAQLNGQEKPTREELKKLYLDKNLSITEIAKMLGYHQPTIYKWLKEYRLR